MFNGANGVFDRSTFNALLAANHMTEGQYVERMRRDIPRSDLLLAVTGGGRGAAGDGRSPLSIPQSKSGSPTSWRCPMPAPAMSGSRPTPS